MIYSIIQIIFAIFLILMLLFVATMIYNYESIVNYRNSFVVKKEVPIFTGIFDFNNAGWVFETYNKTSYSYKELSPSINQQGGAEYSYNFWLRINQNFSSTNDIVLFLRGSKKQIPYLSDTNCAIVDKDKYIFVKNPMIRLKSDGTAIIVEYNTLTSPDAYRENGINLINCNGNWHDKNRGTLGIHTMDDNIYKENWFMLTLILKETNPDDDVLYKNKTSCKIYINGINVLDRIVESPYNGSYGSSAMKHNRGPLYINPGDILADTNQDDRPIKKDDDLKMADMSYFNYALTDAEILTLFKKGFNKATAVKVTTNTDNTIEDQYAIAPLSQQSNNLPQKF